MQQQASVTVTINNPTAGQMLALNDILGATVTPTAAAPTKKAGKKTKPEPTVSEEEEEEFGTKGAVEEEELEEEEAEESEEEESEEEEESLSFDEVKAAINKYGEKKPEDMKAILLGFNMKSTKELEKHKNKWEPVYRKVQIKLKGLKKAK